MKRLLIASSIVAMAACTTSNPDSIRRYETQRMSTVYDATVLSVRPVTVEGSQSGVGVGAGAITGGVAGSSIGRGNGSFVGAVIGAVAGGVIGNAIERGATQENAVEILVQLRNGERRAVVQGATGDRWAPGDAVVLVTTGGRTRVSHAPGFAPDSPPPAPTTYPSQPVPPRS
ncbi:MAG: glycine zipper 2TM domain-containing protein [Pseudomonadota bacterium]|nr:glycine zipper 2TM domain-containing protein [Pseudomonadota bacterium]